MERMNPLDASFLWVEDGISHMTIASCAIFEGPAPPFGDIVDLFAGKLPLVPRYRQRVHFVPFDLGRPVWVDDPHFNLEYHVRRTALPSPGSGRELCALMGRLMSQELDRSRPLWEAWVVEGLEGDRWAMISKVHHCMVDGVAGVDLILLVLDHTREPSPPVADEWQPEPQPSGLRLAADALSHRARSPYEQYRAVRSALRTPTRTARALADVGKGLWNLGGDLVRPTPATTLDGSIGPDRRWGVARTSIEDIRTVRSGLGGTVNDVVLAAVTSGFRSLILSRGEDPEHVVLRSLIPVSVRSVDARGLTDNRVSSILFELPTHVADPVARFEEVRARMDVLKASHEAEGGEALMSLAAYGSGQLQAPLMRAATRLLHRFPQHSVNTVVTNVPGPQFPLYAAGREMLEYHPFVPLSHGVRLGVAILSYNGRVSLGVTGDFDTAADLDVLVAGIEDGMDQLLAASRPKKATAPRKPRKQTKPRKQPANARAAAAR